MNIPFIDLATQQDKIRPLLQQRIDRVLSHGRYIMGPEIKELEERLEDYVSVKHCISVSSGTDALLISLMALGVGPGDEVITSPFTFIATVEMIVLLGATPVLVDVESDTGNLDVTCLEAAITEKTKAIMPVSIFGQPASMDDINEIAVKHGNIPVIEDAAQSFGAIYKGRKSCNLSTMGCTSFFPSKPLGCYGDGGAIFTSDDDLAGLCRELRVHGQSGRYVHTRVGIGGRLDTLQAAILLAKLENFDWEVEERARIGQIYNQKMDVAGVNRIQQKSDRTSVFAQYTILVENREDLVEKLRGQNIPTAVHYPILVSEQEAYREYKNPSPLPVAKTLTEKVLSLPMHPYLEEATIDWVVKMLKKTLSC